jgi:hypothetical protein
MRLPGLIFMRATQDWPDSLVLTRMLDEPSKGTHQPERHDCLPMAGTARSRRTAAAAVAHPADRS